MLQVLRVTNAAKKGFPFAEGQIINHRISGHNFKSATNEKLHLNFVKLIIMMGQGEPFFYKDDHLDFLVQSF